MYSLSDAIIKKDIDQVRNMLYRGIEVNQIDEYGFTPLIETTIMNDMGMAQLVMEAGADVNLKDMVGGTALHWAVENTNIPLVEYLLKKGANPNAYNLSGQSVLVIPILRRQHALKNLLIRYGANLDFAQDYINVKMLGHFYELVGTANIIDPYNQYVEVDFEGFYLEVTLAILTDSVHQFQNHFAARQMRRLAPMVAVIVEVLHRAARLIKLQQYRVDLKQHQAEINSLIQQEPLIIPVGYEGHAITFIKFGDIFVKCDRREDSRLYDNVMIYRVGAMERFTTHFIKSIIYEKHNDDFVNEWLPNFLRLQPITELKVSAQISGNCSWANVEACIPALLFLLSSNAPDFSTRIPHYKSVALNFFHQWREWNKDRALHFCLRSIEHIDKLRKVCKCEIIAAILFQRLSENTVREQERIELILKILMQPEYQYILQNYVKAYCYEDISEEGSHFLRLLERYDFKTR